MELPKSERRDISESRVKYTLGSLKLTMAQRGQDRKKRVSTVWLHRSTHPQLCACELFYYGINELENICYFQYCQLW